MTSLGSLRARGVLLLALGAAVAGCNKGPAEEALAVAEETLEGARSSLERFAPEKLAPLDGALDGARSALAEGRYTDALRVAQELPAWTRRALEAAERRKAGELTAAWDEVSRSAPAQLAGLRSRIAGLAAVASPGSGPEAARLEAAQATLSALGGAWEEAVASFASGDVARALTTAREVASGAEALAATLPPSRPSGRDPESATPPAE